MPFWKKDSEPRIRQLVEEENYDEIAALASRDSSAARQLVELLLDSEEEVREAAAYGLASIGKNDHRVPDVIRTVMPELITLLKHPKVEVRRAATGALAGIAWNWLMWDDFAVIAGPLVPRVTKLLYDADVKVRTKAAEAVSQLAAWTADEGRDTSQLADALPQLVKLLRDPVKDLRSNAVEALVSIARRRPDLVAASASAIAELLADRNDYICNFACVALMYVAESHPESVKPLESRLLALFEGPDRWLANDCAAIALGFVGADTPHLVERIAPRLIECLNDRSAPVRAGAARALARIAERRPELAEPALPLLKDMLQDEDEGIRLSASAALRSIRP